MIMTSKPCIGRHTKVRKCFEIYKTVVNYRQPPCPEEIHNLTEVMSTKRTLLSLRSIPMSTFQYVTAPLQVLQL